MIDICFHCKKECKGFVIYKYIEDIRIDTISYRLWNLPRCCCTDYTYYRTDDNEPR